eukprot:m.442807 g.442807  ORF g.442807 m.442807 type:complete len:57 (+) comp21477_c0_seq11:356-526(+)
MDWDKDVISRADSCCGCEPDDHDPCVFRFRISPHQYRHLTSLEQPGLPMVPVHSVI